MNRFNSPSLLTPPKEEEEIYPYRRVWPSIIRETGILLGITAATYVGFGIIGITLSDGFQGILNAGIALLPAALWLVFSYLPERHVPEPRRDLGGVFVITILATNAIALPLLRLLEPEQWLPGLGLISRAIGYAVTLGIVNEMLKYIVLRLIIWPEGLRIRLDAVAYFTASAIAYVTVINLNLVMTSGTATPDVIAGRVFFNTVTHLAASGLFAFGLAYARFNPKSFMVMPLFLLAAIFVTGIATAARSNLMTTGFVLGIGGTRPLLALIFSAAMIIAILFTLIFLFNTVERQEREAITSREL